MLGDGSVLSGGVLGLLAGIGAVFTVGLCDPSSPYINHKSGRARAKNL